jgi:hypothetical protein
VDDKLTRTEKNIATGVMDLESNGIQPGNRSVKIVSYKENVPFQSSTKIVTQLSLLAEADSYATYFINANEINGLVLDEMSLQNLTGTTTQLRKSLQTTHNYATDKNYEVLIRTPIVISSSFPKMFYKDIAIVEPKHDSVVVEATKNGLDWIPLRVGYDANYNQQWQSAFTQNLPGSGNMFVSHELDLSEKLSAGDLVLFRLRLISNASVTAWGWALDYISIQEKPGIPTTESMSLYPNPILPGQEINVQYILTQPSTVSVRIYDVYGRSVRAYAFGDRSAGSNTETILLENLTVGNYILVVESKDGKRSRKIHLD